MSEIYQIDEETNQLSKAVLDKAFMVHTELGPGLLESVYEDCLYYFLTKDGISVERQKQVPISIKEFDIPSRLRLDLIVEDKIIIEIKAIERLLPIHDAQLHTYLKLSKVSLGLLINFNTRSLKDGIKRIAMCQNQQIKNFV